ncbi:Hypothetical protein NTJ_03420 [Nesidiocoris tenuis]|uniref:RdRp catalytic domain-containing protein n=1 Tax=Nesidiocoris tenuis TaxID=355587 RepID=A0ABN7AEA9_9HEMI|nr:Hypothetical protein NTJ_03420 [Nesidiocoris tenuis]
MTNPRKHEGSIPVMISMDIEKFYQTWRKESTQMICTFLDKIYGVRCYEKSMWICDTALFYLSSRMHPPAFMPKGYTRNGVDFFSEEDNIDKQEKEDAIMNYYSIQDPRGL